MSPSFSTGVASTPVSSVTSRRAVSSARSPGPMRPFGSAHVPSGLPAGRIAATTGRPRSPVRMPWHSPQESANGCHKVWTGGGWMNLQPLGDRLIVEVLDEEETTVSGIVLPDTAKEKPQRGRVLAVGPGARDEGGDYIKMDLEEGDEIIFSKYGGTEIKLGTDEVLILRESDVLAKVTTSPRRKRSTKKEMAGATA